MRCQFANYGGQSKKLKEHGIYTQARCRIRGWELHESDMQILEENTDPEVILKHMPKRIFVEMELKTFPQYDDLPENWVPLPPTMTDWYLDKAQAIQIKRRGFALAPDFSSTIHSATGRTLNSCVPDLGSIEDTPNSQKAMAYCFISRDRCRRRDPCATICTITFQARPCSVSNAIITSSQRANFAIGS